VSAIANITAAACAVAIATGCGSSDGGSSSTAGAGCRAAGASSVHKSRTVYFAWPDVTGSTQKTRATYLPDMITFAKMAAGARAPFYADAFTGAPEDTTSWPVSCDFSVTPKAFDGNKDLERSYLLASADRLRTPLHELLSKRQGHGRSPLLNVLAVSSLAVSSHRGATACIAVFTDAEVLGPDFSVKEVLNQTQRVALANRWAPRLTALKGAKVYVVGVGRGTRLTVAQLSYVRSVIGQLLARVGAQLSVFDTRLAPDVRC
jgi:hypothetical protein